VNITEVRVRLVEDKNERLKAFCCMTLDGEFVVRDIKVIDGVKGLFVAMPSRKITDHCPKCGGKNPLKAKHCNDCGAELTGGKFVRVASPTDKLHADIAHPINPQCRAKIQEAVVAAYKQEIERSAEPGYRPPKDVTVDEVELEETDKKPGAGAPAPEAPKKEGGFTEGIL
jgi:stage V sporulation protein G